MLAIQSYGDSPTWDEVGHFAAGIDVWKHVSFQLYAVNPPLVRTIAAIPVILCARDFDSDLLYRGSPLPCDRAEFSIGPRVASALGGRYFHLLTFARLACIPFSILGAFICYRWSYVLFGQFAGVIALTLWVFSPSVLGYGHLIVPDMGATGLGLAAAYSFRSWLRAQTPHRALLAGVCLGLAELTKMTWIVLLVLWPLIWTLDHFSQRWTNSASSVSRSPARVVAIVVLAVWVLNLGYLFEKPLKLLGNYQFVSASLAGSGEATGTSPTGLRLGNRFYRTVLRGIPVPLPENYVLGLDAQRRDFERKQESYLRGEWRDGGWWYYYLYAMLIKEPLAVWMLGLLSLVAAVLSKGYRAPFCEELLLLAPAITVIALVSSQTGYNHHLRYVLPAFPFIFISISRVGKCLELRHLPLAGTVVLALACSVISSLSVFPHSLSYFNELAGGPTNGHSHLGNSNTDWGQDLLYLKKWYDRHPAARPLHLGFDMPLIDPTMAGIMWKALPRLAPGRGLDPTLTSRLGPQPGWFVVSVNKLHDREHRYDYFNDVHPIDRVGYTLRVYHVSLREANALRRKYALPPLPLTGPEGAAALTR